MAADKNSRQKSRHARKSVQIKISQKVHGKYDIRIYLILNTTPKTVAKDTLQTPLETL